MRVYHYLEEKWALDDIRRRRLKLSRLDKLNDPFELLSVANDDFKFRHSNISWKAEMASRYGMICFSKKISNPVQWSHYANHHRGIFLSFEVPEESLFHVNYVSKRIAHETLATALERADEQEALKIMHTMLSTKYLHWKYEAEARAIFRLDVEEGGNYFAKFDQSLKLREVLIGAEADTSRREVEDALGDLEGVTAVKMRLAYRSFSVVKNRDQSLWR